MKVFYKILLVLGVSIGLVAALYFMQPGPKKNGFKRNAIKGMLLTAQTDLKYNYWYIDSLSEDSIYLGNYVAVLAAFSCDYDFRDSSYRRLPYPDSSRQKLEMLKQRVLKQINPGKDKFKTDGFLSRNEPAGRLVYTYYYRNAFVCLDTGMRVLYTARMIDTNSVAKIKTAVYRTNGKKVRTMATPPVPVNKRGYIDGDYFYNQSALAADDEDLAGFMRPPSVIDVYRLSNGKYSHSIYLPWYGDGTLISFGVRGNRLVAVYGRDMVIYQLTGKED